MYANIEISAVQWQTNEATASKIEKKFKIYKLLINIQYDTQIHDTYL